MKTRSWTVDCAIGENPPLAGAIVASTRARYELLEVIPVESRIWPNRFRFVMRRLPSDDPVDGEWPVTPYRRGEGPADHFGAPS